MDERRVRERLKVLALALELHPCSLAGVSNSSLTPEQWQEYKMLNAEFRLLLTPMLVLELLEAEEHPSTAMTPASTPTR